MQMHMQYGVEELYSFYVPIRLQLGWVICNVNFFRMAISLLSQYIVVKALHFPHTVSIKKTNSDPY